MLIVGCGAGGGVLAQRLARAGWRVVRARARPVLGSRHATGSPTRTARRTSTGTTSASSAATTRSRWARTTPATASAARWCTTPATRRASTRPTSRRATRDGVGADWPIAYGDLKPHYRAGRARAAGRRPGLAVGRPALATRTRRTRSAAPPSGPGRGARAHGIEMRVGPVAITNGVFGNRPHCIYRGFCLQGCKVNAKASPLVTHVPDAIEHGVEIRADSHGGAGRGRRGGPLHVASPTSTTAVNGSSGPAAVAVCGYSIETPRLLLNSTSPRLPRTGSGTTHDQVGRYLMVQGAPQVAGRFPELLRMYKAPPPEVSSEQFYETDPSRGFARGFSIQTVSPLPIGWAEHVLADGHRGAALREYMRDYNHWAVLGALCELLPQPENRVTLADETDAVRHADRPVRLHPVRQRPRATSPSPSRRCTTSGRPRAPRTCSRSTAMRTSSAAAGWARAPRQQRRRRRPPRLGRPKPLRRRRQRDADPGQRQPGAHDHGARVAAGRRLVRKRVAHASAARRSVRGDGMSRARSRGRRRDRRVGGCRPRDRARVRRAWRGDRAAGTGRARAERRRPRGRGARRRRAHAPGRRGRRGSGRGRRGGGRGALRAHRRVGEQRDGDDLRSGRSRSPPRSSRARPR